MIEPASVTPGHALATIKAYINITNTDRPLLCDNLNAAKGEENHDWRKQRLTLNK